MAKKKHYKARWLNADTLTTRGSVDFDAISDHHAKMQAEKIAREIQCSNSPMTLTCEGRQVSV